MRQESLSIGEGHDGGTAYETLGDDASDAKLMERLKADGDPEAFAAIQKKYRPGILRYLSMRLGNKADAEDATQEVFLALFLRCASFHSGARLEPWLYAMTSNRAIDEFRRRRSRTGGRMMMSLDGGHGSSESGDGITVATPPVSKEEDPSVIVGRKETCCLVREEVQKLPKRYREVLLMRHRDGMEFPEIAEKIDIPLGTVKSRHHKGKELLKQVPDIRKLA